MTKRPTFSDQACAPGPAVEYDGENRPWESRFVEYKDYYQTLGVEKSASADDIKKAYRKLVRKYHPDVSKHKDADSKTKEINEAYDVLGDAEKRAAYDELGSGRRAGQEFQPPPDWASAWKSVV